MIKVVGGIGRTGTRSLNKALNILGYNSKHFPRIFNGKHDAYTDSSVFFGNVLEGWNCKVIWLDRDISNWLQSWERHSKLKQSPQTLFIRQNVFGSEIYNPDQWAWAYEKHRKRCDSLDTLFTKIGYWEPICDFLNKPIPDVPFPYIKDG